jgi:hypothetical protein
MPSGSTAMWRRAAQTTHFSNYVFMSGQREAFSAMRWICGAPQSRPWSARRDGISYSACREEHRYRLRRRANDNVPFSSLATRKALRSWSALRTDAVSLGGRSP